MTPPTPPRQLRLIIETDDFDEALAFYRDILGMPEQPAFATSGDDRVAILHAGIATIELATSAHIANIDAIEGAPTPTRGRPRLALEVDDTAAVASALETAGAAIITQPRTTPFRSINARIEAPAGWTLTLFQELEPLATRHTRPGFSHDEARPR